MMILGILPFLKHIQMYFYFLSTTLLPVARMCVDFSSSNLLGLSCVLWFWNRCLQAHSYAFYFFVFFARRPSFFFLLVST